MCSWVSFIMLALCFPLIIGVSDSRHRKQLHSAATLVGTVYCDTCFRQPTPKSAHFISGAKVAVECGDNDNDNPKQRFRQEVKTNENGEFEVKLPVSISKHVEKIKGCSVRLISSGKPYCSVAATATSSQIQFKSKKAGVHIFFAGFFTFKPELCDQKDFTEKGFPPSLPDPPAPFLPPVPILDPLPVPLPDLPVPVPVPPLPRLPGVPLPPIITRQKVKPSESDKLSDQKTFGLPPNPFKPPALTPPLPLMPPLLPSLPPVSISLFPPVPGLISSPPPPAFPVPLPGFPSVPPASTSTDLKKTTP